MSCRTLAQYLMAGQPAEVARLQVQGRAWELEVEALLNEIGIERGWRCIDVGCGPEGIIGPLARRAGTAGLVIAVDQDPIHLNAARGFVESEGFMNVEVRQGDLFSLDLDARSFDLVHARFVLAALGREQEILERLARLVRDGGIIALEEPDASTWSCDPPSPFWNPLKAAVMRAFEKSGGDLKMGQRLGSLLRRGGLRPVTVREATLTLAGRHPYSSALLHFAHALRRRILSQGLLTEAELDAATRSCADLLQGAYTTTRTFRLVQAWARVNRSVDA